MTSGPDDTGSTREALLNAAWCLGVVAGVAWFRFAYLLDREAPLDHELGLWLAAAVLGTVFSAACGLLSALKAVEHRQASRGASSEEAA